MKASQNARPPRRGPLDGALFFLIPDATCGRNVGYCLRYANRTRRRPALSGPISLTEQYQALYRVIKYTQQIYYFELYKQIAAHRNIVQVSLAQLAPYLDQAGFIRVGGRLKHWTLNDDVKHTILLPQRCHHTELIIWHYYQLLLHGGARVVLSMITLRATILDNVWSGGCTSNSLLICSMFKISGQHS